MSYLLTYSGKAVQEFHKSHAKARRYTQHVVRWGKSWGFIQPSPNWDTAWQAETRTPVAEHEHGTDKFLLEKTTPSLLQAPPLTIDDMWSEMVIFDRHIKAGNLLYIRGTLSEIQETLKQLNIFTPSWLQSLALVLAPQLPQSPTTELPKYPMTPPPQSRQPSQVPLQQGQGQPRQMQQRHQLQQRASQTPLRTAPISTGNTTSSRPPQPSFQHRPLRQSPASGLPSSPAQSSHSTQSRSQGTLHQRNQSQQTFVQRGQTSQ